MEEVLIQIRVQPGAQRTEIVGWDGEVLRVRVQAPPVEGRANAQVEELLARALRLPRSSVAVWRGGRARRKLVSVRGLEEAAVRERLAAAARPGAGR